MGMITEEHSPAALLSSILSSSSPPPALLSIAPHVSCIDRNREMKLEASLKAFIFFK